MDVLSEGKERLTEEEHVTNDETGSDHTEEHDTKQ